MDKEVRRIFDKCDCFVYYRKSLIYDVNNNNHNRIYKIHKFLWTKKFLSQSFYYKIGRPLVLNIDDNMRRVRNFK